MIFLPCISCKPVVRDQPQAVTYWVNSLSIPCQGVAPASCLQVQRASYKPGEWKNFYPMIEGFEFEPGFLYKLSVKEEHLPPGQVPADGSSTRYFLLEVLEKKPDPRLRLNDIWVLETIRAESINDILRDSGINRPYLEIHLADNRILGNEGCNDFRADILVADEENFSAGHLTVSDRICEDRGLSGSFAGALSEAAKYQIEGLRLIFFDKDGQELLGFHKTD